MAFFCYACRELNTYAKMMNFVSLLYWYQMDVRVSAFSSLLVCIVGMPYVAGNEHSLATVLSV
jgi:hypothetical protein